MLKRIKDKIYRMKVFFRADDKETKEYESKFYWCQENLPKGWTWEECEKVLPANYKQEWI